MKNRKKKNKTVPITKGEKTNNPRISQRMNAALKKSIKHLPWPMTNSRYFARSILEVDTVPTKSAGVNRDFIINTYLRQ